TGGRVTPLPAATVTQIPTESTMDTWRIGIRRLKRLRTGRSTTLITATPKLRSPILMASQPTIEAGSISQASGPVDCSLGAFLPMSLGCHTAHSATRAGETLNTPLPQDSTFS